MISGKYNNPKSVISVLMIMALFLIRFFVGLKAQWGSIVTESVSVKQSNDRFGIIYKKTIAEVPMGSSAIVSSVLLPVTYSVLH